MSDRLRTDVFVSALIKSVETAGGFATILEKGHEIAGVVSVVVRRGRQDVDILTEEFKIHGSSEWRTLKSAVSDDEVVAHIEKEVSFDADHWFIEVEGVSVEFVRQSVR